MASNGELLSGHSLSRRKADSCQAIKRSTAFRLCILAQSQLGVTFSAPSIAAEAVAHLSSAMDLAFRQ